jgi:integrase
VTTRTASLQVSHSSFCPNAGKNSLESVDRACRAARSDKGARCTPRYFTLHREEGPNGRPKKVAGERFSDRREAEKELRRLQVEIDQGRAEPTKRRREELTLRQWAKRYEEIAQQRVDDGSMKRRTLEAYNETLRLYGLPAIGNVLLGRIGQAELRVFYGKLSALTPAGKLRHLRQLSVVLSEAVDDELIDVNPVPKFTKKLKLRLPRRGKAPFEDGEIERLWSVYEARVHQPKKPYAAVYYYATRFALETAVRVGELVALDLDNLRGSELRVEHTFDAESGLITPKDGEARTVYLTNEAIAVLALWLPLRGDETGPLFPNPSGGRLVAREIQRKFTVVMDDAGIPKLHPELGLPRTLHSLRYTTSNRMQRLGYHPRLIEATLGHSNLELTYGVYGGWTPDQLRAAAARN